MRSTRLLTVAGAVLAAFVSMTSTSSPRRPRVKSPGPCATPAVP